MLGSFDNSLGSTRSEADPVRSATAASTQEPLPGKQRGSNSACDQLLVREWSELPYAMMRLTAARRPWDGNRFYWRDRNVQLGDDRSAVWQRVRATDTTRPPYTATYAREDLRRDFALHPSLEDDQLRWSAPGIC